MSDVLTEFESLIMNSNLPELVIFMKDHKIPHATITLYSQLICDCKLSEKNNHPSFSLEMYVNSEN